MKAVVMHCLDNSNWNQNSVILSANTPIQQYLFSQISRIPSVHTNHRATSPRHLGFVYILKISKFPPQKSD